MLTGSAAGLPAIGGADKELLEPIKAAFAGRSNDELETITKAIQAWDGEGMHDGLSVSALRNYINRSHARLGSAPPKAPAAKKKPKKAAPRWETCSIAHVAALVEE